MWPAPGLYLQVVEWIMEMWALYVGKSGINVAHRAITSHDQDLASGSQQRVHRARRAMPADAHSSRLLLALPGANETLGLAFPAVAALDGVCVSGMRNTFLTFLEAVMIAAVGSYDNTAWQTGRARCFGDDVSDVVSLNGTSGAEGNYYSQAWRWVGTDAAAHQNVMGLLSLGSAATTYSISDEQAAIVNDFVTDASNTFSRALLKACLFRGFTEDEYELPGNVVMRIGTTHGL